MKFRNIIWGLLAVLALASCKEEDDAVEEYANWQNTNDAFFSRLVSENTMPTVGYTLSYYDNIVAEKLEQGSGTTSPLLTDSVKVHYVGHLLPSTSYPQGLVFDRSYVGNFDPELATPTKLSVLNVVKGFSTALMRMHRGDYWRIYIPYQLGYGGTARSSIPAYSTLVFDLRLEDFWQKTQGDRE